jgi:CRISPR-associated protein Cas2
VQKSVFECPDLTEKQLLTMKDTLEALINHETDSVRYYRLCRSCLRTVEWSGQGFSPYVDTFVII